MKMNDTLWMGLRSLRERPLETGLLILGIALASCIAAAAILLQGSQRIQTEKLLEGPAYREIVVRSSSGGDPGSQTQSLREVTQTNGTGAQIGDKDMAAILEAIPEVTHAYRYSNDTLRTNDAGGPGQMMVMAAPGAAATPSAAIQAGAGQSSAATGTANQAGVAPAGSTPAGTTPAGSTPAGTTPAGTTPAADTMAPPEGGPEAFPGAAPADTASAAASVGAGATPEGGATPATPAGAATPGTTTPGAATPAGPEPFGDPFAQDQTTLAADETLLTTEVESFRSLEASADFFAAYGLQTAWGNLFTDTDSQNRAAMVVLGGSLAARLFPDLEPEQLVGRKVRLNNRIYTITGILDAESDAVSLSNGSLMGDMAVTPAFQMVMRSGGQTIIMTRGNSTLRFAVADIDDLEEVTKALEDYFVSTYGENTVTITVPWEEARLGRTGFDRLLWIIVAFGTGAFLMALINLMNMMLTRSLRRQAPMGILSAMGARRTDLLTLQAVEGGAMAVLGTLIGLGLSIPLYHLLYDAGRNLFGIGSGSAPLDVGVFLATAPALTILAMLMAFLPALQGSRLSISTALKAE